METNVKSFKTTEKNQPSALAWMSDAKPQYIETPALKELQAQDQWVGWRYETRRGKETKPPMRLDWDKHADITDPNNWGSYEQASEAAIRFGYDGVGFVLANGYAGIDLDNVRNWETGEILPGAQEIIKEVDGYAEISPSKTGVKIFVKGQVPTGIKKDMGGWSVEIYSENRYFTVTGWALEV